MKVLFLLLASPKNDKDGSTGPDEVIFIYDRQQSGFPPGRQFRDMARELECDEDEAAFEDKVRKVATSPKPEADDLTGG